MQVLKTGDTLVCTKGYGVFTTGELYAVTSVSDSSFHVPVAGRPYWGRNDERGITVSSGDFRNHFELYIPRALHKQTFFQDVDGLIPATKVGDPVGLIKTPTWTWTHRRSALVHVMLLEGCKYIMCEVADEDRDFEWIDSLDIVIITEAQFFFEEDKLKFLDINGDYHNAAQPVNLDGSIMSYGQYLKMKK